MAIVFSQNVFLWADLLTDLTGSGSDDGITTDQIGWAEDQNNWYYCTATAAGTSTWVALSTGGTAELGSAVENTGATNPALMDATFTWQITQTENLTFENATSNNNLLVLAPAAGADVVTLGWGSGTSGGDTVLIDSEICDINSTTLTLNYATWPSSDGTSGQALTTNGAGTLSWSTAGALAGIPSNIYEDLLFYVDAADRNSYPSTGTTVVDLMGNATSGTLTAVTYEDGAFNYDATTNTRISFTKGATLDNLFATGGTVMVWVRLADDGQAANGILVDTSGDADAGWYISTISVSAGHLTFRFQRHYTTTSGATFTANNITQPWTGGTDRPIHKTNWTSLCITFDDTSTAQPGMYVNGTAVTVTTNTGITGVPQSDAGNPITLGNIGTNFDQCMDGQLGVVMMWDRVLAADEIQRAHSAFSVRYGQGLRGGDGKLIGSNGFNDMSGQDLWIRAGDSAAIANSEAEGGHIYIIAGNHTGSGLAASGRIYIASGSGAGNNSTAGEILIESGANSAGGSAVTLQVGTQNHGGGVGTLTIRGGDNDGTGGSGAVFIRSGATVATSGVGGSMTVRAADGTDNGGTNVTGGTAEFRAGDGVNRAGGSCTVRAGNSSSGSGGNLTLTAGTANAGNGTGGTITMAAGNASGNGSNGGHVNISSGNNSNNNPVGDITFTTGDTVAAFSGRPAGKFQITTGDSLTAGSQGTSGGGDFEFIGGSSIKTSTTSPGGRFLVTAGPGVANSANSRGGTVELTGGEISGTTAGAVAGDIILTGGSIPNTTGTPGGITLTPGTDNSTGIGDITISYAVWPQLDGSSGQVLTTNGAGALSWGAAAGILLAGREGILYNGNTFFMDAGDRTSYSGSGTTVYDLINQTSGTISGVQIVNGHFNYNAATDDINFGTVVSGETQDVFSGGGTVAVWVRPESDGFGTGGIIATTADDTTTDGWTLRVDDQAGTAVDITLLVGASTTQGNWATSGGLQVGQWHHVVIVYNSDTASNDPLIYIDGVQATVDVDNNYVGAYGTDSGNTLFVGGNTGGTAAWEGDLDVVIFYNRQLSTAEIEQLYRVQQDRFRPSLMGLDASVATSDAVDVSITGGDGGATAGAGGSIVTTGGAGIAGNSTGGDITTTAGASAGTATGGVLTFTAGQGGPTGAGGTAVFEGGDGGSTSGAGGQSTLRGGSGTAGNSDGGNALVRGGTATGTGTNGAVALVTTDTDAPVGILTTGTSFQGTVHNHYTYGAQITATISTTGILVVTLGTLTANGQNLKVDARATGVDDAVDTNVMGIQYAADYYRAGGTVSSLGSYQNNFNSTGVADWTSNVNFTVAINGDDIELQIDNNSTTTNYDINIAVYWDIQEGGFAS